LFPRRHAHHRARHLLQRRARRRLLLPLPLLRLLLELQVWRQLRARDVSEQKSLLVRQGGRAGHLVEGRRGLRRGGLYQRRPLRAGCGSGGSVVDRSCGAAARVGSPPH
jgi:hypothetical protein